LAHKQLLTITDISQLHLSWVVFPVVTGYQGYSWLI
jgi:hypothetical protein